KEKNDSPCDWLCSEVPPYKSTLLEAIAIALGFNAEGGTKNFRFSTNDSHSSLHEYLRISKSFNTPNDGFFLRAESFYNVASYIDEMDADPEARGNPIIDSPCDWLCSEVPPYESII
ncbi:hypothetical protein ACT453_35200, partial [Bacillus sp. D-CC]